MELDDLKMDFSVKDIQMGIKNVHNGNTIIGTVTYICLILNKNVNLGI